MPPCFRQTASTTDEVVNGSLLPGLEKGNGLLCTTTLKALELFRGAYLSRNRDEKIDKVRRILEQLIVLPITEESYDVYECHLCSALI